MKRFVNGIMEEPIWQKRVPQNLPEWLQTATVAFPSGRTAEELVANDAAHLVWAVNLGVIDFNPWPARRTDLDHPDELRVDLDPTPGIGWDRSEEHTSELQSHVNLVCRLLLEKKKKNKTTKKRAEKNKKKEKKE